jgi:hypothetical protein
MELEEQMVLRVPKRIADQIRSALRAKEESSGGESKKQPKDVHLEFTFDGWFFFSSSLFLSFPSLPFKRRVVGIHGTAESGRSAGVKFNDEQLVGTLLDLPLIVETLKTYDGRNYYKSADVGQVYLTFILRRKKKPHSSSLSI